MRHSTHIVRFAAMAALGLGAHAAQAQYVAVSDDYIFRGEICVGFNCAEAAYTGDDGIRMIESTLRMLFEDRSSPTGSFPANDWRFVFNDAAQNGLNYFAVEDVDAGVMPFMIEAGAPANQFRMAPSGYIGFGTSLPQKHLHVIDGKSPTLRLEQDNSGGDGYVVWDIATTNGGLQFSQYTPWFDEYKTPLYLRQGAPTNSLVINNAGNVGLNTLVPLSPIHIFRDDGTAAMLVEETDPTANPRTLLNLQNNGRPEIVMGNTATNGEWSFGAGTDFFLKVGAVGSTSGGKTKVFTVKNNGDAIVQGTLTTGGTTCGGGCDLVFAESYDLPSIEDHAERMFDLGHLPNVGPTIEGQPFNLTDKVGRMLNELEHAHIFIAQQQDVIAQQQADIAQLKRDMAALKAARISVD